MHYRCVLFITFTFISASSDEAGFTSGPQNVSAMVGDDVVFQCIIRNASEFRRSTLKYKRILTARKLSIYQQSQRILARCEGSIYRLRISDVTIEDEGKYYCEITGGAMPIVQTHSLTVTIAPTIDKSQQETDLHVYLGESVTLKCPAEGRPDPVVTWRREDLPLPSGENVFIGNELKLSDLDRLDSGSYTCIASNGAGIPDSLEVQLHVDYEPSVHVTEELIHTGPGQEVHIECVFSASPQVDVTWKHNGSDIDFGLRSNLISETHNERSMDLCKIKIQDMRPSDVGEYSCKGVNSLGAAEGTVVISALPHSLAITSDPNGPYSDQYTLHWNVQTLAQLIDFNLKFKAGNHSEEFSESNIPAPLDHEVPLHSQEYTFLDLEPNATFVVQMRARNPFGHSNWTELFYFSTKEAGNEAPATTTTTRAPSTRRPTRAPTTPKSNVSSAGFATSSFVLHFVSFIFASSFLL
ncbi:hypothetical protein CAPTEDRAFT_180340 [Capitella teleta]|uniref:Ig-like domain-containing protein n=1 Tax=Capitella teleta TaxID=283909 RepID=R7U9C2_CAPTE|nr:hypothetical protein CAPTEDRAFT_180340 [Capitella teleta]|eukprot:ELT99735.1 hypothetical protein CAPTEDRAFT_180340 [Capitella teleta]